MTRALVRPPMPAGWWMHRQLVEASQKLGKGGDLERQRRKADATRACAHTRADTASCSFRRSLKGRAWWLAWVRWEGCGSIGQPGTFGCKHLPAGSRFFAGCVCVLADALSCLLCPAGASAVAAIISPCVTKYRVGGSSVIV